MPVVTSTAERSRVGSRPCSAAADPWLRSTREPTPDAVTSLAASAGTRRPAALAPAPAPEDGTRTAPPRATPGTDPLAASTAAIHRPRSSRRSQPTANTPRWIGLSHPRRTRASIAPLVRPRSCSWRRDATRYWRAARSPTRRSTSGTTDPPTRGELMRCGSGTPTSNDVARRHVQRGHPSAPEPHQIRTALREATPGRAFPAPAWRTSTARPTAPGRASPGPAWQTSAGRSMRPSGRAARAARCPSPSARTAPTTRNRLRRPRARCPRPAAATRPARTRRARRRARVARCPSRPRSAGP